MRRKETFLIIITLTIMFLLTGCGYKVKEDVEVKKDLIESEEFELVDGSDITSFSVFKRRTDISKKSDIVYVSLEIDHDAAHETRAYRLDYTKKRDGWFLEGIREYDGDDVKWSIMLKQGGPTNEEIMEALLEYPRTQIEKIYSERPGYESIIKRNNFFEDGKYATKVFSGELISDLQYWCLVETKRSFEEMGIVEYQVLRLRFNKDTYKWEIYEASIVDFGNVSRGLEETGTIDRTYNDEIIKYAEKARDAIDIMFMEADISTFNEIWYKPNERLTFERWKDIISERTCDVLFCFPYEWYVLTDEEIEEAKEVIHNIKSAAFVQFIVQMRYDDKIFYELLPFQMIEIDEDFFIYEMSDDYKIDF